MVNPTPVTVENKITTESPIISVQVDPTPITVENKVEPTPVTVNPTPITIENKNEINVPENTPQVIVEPSEPKVVKVIRDKNGKITGMEEEK